MAPKALGPGELAEVISYASMITGIGLAWAGAFVRLASSTPAWMGLFYAAGALGTLGALFWRFSTSIERRMARATRW